MKKLMVGAVALFVVAAAVADGFKAPVHGSFDGTSGAWTNDVMGRCGIASIIVYGNLGGSNVVIRIANNLSVNTNAASSPIISDTVSTNTSYYFSDGATIPIEDQGVIYFECPAGGTNQYSIYTVVK